MLCLLLKAGSLPLVEVANATDPPAAAVSPAVSESSCEGASWHKQLASTTDEWDKAKIYDRLGALCYRVNRHGEAISWWDKSAAIYRRSQNSRSQQHFAKTALDQAQAYLAIGQYERAIARARQATRDELKLPPQVAAIAWGTLANAYARSGDLNAALANYDKSYALTSKHHNREYTATIVSNQVGVLLDRAARLEERARLAEAEGEEESAALLARADKDRQNAANKVALALALTQNSKGLVAAKALLNAIQVEPRSSLERFGQVKEILQNLPDSRTKAAAWIDLAQFGSGEQQLDALFRALAVAKNPGDRRTESLAAGEIGSFYERQKNFARAMKFTQQAQFAAQAASALDSLYRWQWQAGRLYAATGNEPEAIAAYRQAVNSLSGIRGKLITAERVRQFTFREQVEPVYRQLLALLLKEGKNQDLQSALTVAKLLKIGQLQNFFGDECLELAATESAVAPKPALDTVTITSVLADRPYTILQFPDGRLNSYAIELSVADLTAKVQQWRGLLETVATQEYFPVAREMYDLLIRPLEKDLDTVKPAKLVFVNDGALRTIPMSALHDGKRFLVEKYPIAYSLGLQPVRDEHLERGEALIFGLSEAVPPLPALPYVVPETQFLQQMLDGKNFLNRDFNANTLAAQVAREQQHLILHLATHGAFSNAAGNSFIQAHDRRLYLPQFENILRTARQPLELLTFSACETAAGDDRAVLGLAGLAARNGVKNVVATLWSVNDADIVPAIKNFYRAFKTDIPVEEALRQAQLESIHNRVHPATWSALIPVKS
ncbi:CHAT domain-containing protein [Chroococcidiopsis sp. SAG 2025]|uniref:CHAT domain-containing protein n=1 Tax=Chroococcidiopsis sp. SAG 2025 TaxID=171389 RepID=UPI002936EE11|nr:CHAT domain-containing protein [Chroococcidiopsis sp. SAG 2025]